MKILGIDPGSHRIGYAILEKNPDRKGLLIVDYDVLQVAANTPSPENLGLIFSGLNTLIDHHQPDCASIEKLFFYKNVRTAGDVYQARGVILLSLFHGKIPIVEPTVTQIKKGITGNGNAGKKQVKTALQLIFNQKLEHNLDDAWDAIAVAFVGNSMLSANLPAHW